MDGDHVQDGVAAQASSGTTRVTGTQRMNVLISTTIGGVVQKMFCGSKIA